MSTAHTANCRCGYHREFLVGGTRASFMETSLFPFYCIDCGLVSINVRSKGLACSRCSGPEVKQYGRAPISEAIDDSTIVAQCWDLTLFREQNLCPGCNEMTLVFSTPEAYFD